MSRKILLLAMLLCSVAWAAQQTRQLCWKPAQGDKFAYEMFLAVPGDQFELEARIEHEVAFVDEMGSYGVRSKSAGALLKVRGSEMRDERPNDRVARYGAEGQLLEIQSGNQDMESYRLAIVTKFVAPPVPVKEGDTWRYEGSGLKVEGLPKFSVRYKFERVITENGKSLAEVTFKIEESSGESPQKGEGKWMIDLTNGFPNSMEAQIENFQGKKDAKATVRLKRA